MAAYLDVCAETAKMLVLFGKATAFAASTVAGYMNAIDASLCTNATLIGDDGNSPWRGRKPPLRRVIENEVHAGLATIGGKKNPSVSRYMLAVRRSLLLTVDVVASCGFCGFWTLWRQHSASALSKATSTTSARPCPKVYRTA